MSVVDEVRLRALSDLRPHPENSAIFGDPSESKQYPDILKSIRDSGIWEPLAIKADGTILSGHLRYACAQALKLEAVPTRVRPAFAHYRDEVSFVIRSNTDRRQLSLQEVAFAFKRLKELPKEQGGAKRRNGGDRKSPGIKNQSAESSGLIGETRDDAALHVGVSRNIAEAAETIFTSSDVPQELKSAVNSGKVAPTTAAKQVREERKRQGGTITDPSRLVAVAEHKTKPVQRTPQDRAAAFVNSDWGKERAAARAQREADVRRLSEDGMSTSDIAKRLGLTPNSVSQTRSELGLTRKDTDENPLARILNFAIEASDHWQSVNNNFQDKWKLASEIQREEATKAIRASADAAHRFIQRLNKEAKGNNT